MNTPLRIGIVGMGRVGRYLASQFKKAKLEVHCFSQKEESGFISLNAYSHYINTLDVVLLCVPDTAVFEVSSRLEASTNLIAHVSGTTSIQALDLKHNQRGIFYPLMSLTQGSAVNVETIPFCLEANTENALAILRKLANTLGVRTHVINSEQRKKLHLAAVLSQNFSNLLFQKAYEVMTEAQLPFDLLKPLLLQAVERLGNDAPLKFQTGPAIRKDQNTIDSHLASLKDSNTQEIYKLITRSIQENEKEL
jgi:predicted short-subunit dehydrogenase-like oxidoreductase (DUF2520 family)